MAVQVRANVAVPSMHQNLCLRVFCQNSVLELFSPDRFRVPSDLRVDRRLGAVAFPLRTHRAQLGNLFEARSAPYPYIGVRTGRGRTFGSDSLALGGHRPLKSVPQRRGTESPSGTSRPKAGS